MRNPDKTLEPVDGKLRPLETIHGTVQDGQEREWQSRSGQEGSRELNVCVCVCVC